MNDRDLYENGGPYVPHAELAVTACTMFVSAGNL
jgi:hypothetical protein